VDARLQCGWNTDPLLLAAARNLFVYGPGEDRATGYVFAAGEQAWPDALLGWGSGLVDGLERLLGIRFTIALFQAYRNGSGCGWHSDDAFDAQAILSLGVTRTFGVRQPDAAPVWMRLHHGDLLYMPPGFQVGWEHCVPVEDVSGERISLVFRTVAKT
jgi:alkylated DNA repair dioxygenase AlkB